MVQAGKGGFKMKASNLRLTAGLLALPAILLQDSTFGVMLQALYVIILAITHGRRFRLLPNLILLVSVASAHLLQPNGLLLFSLGNFPITVGALVLGARKAFTLIALLYLSHYMVTGRPEFPGTLGRLISMQFYYFERITTGWKAIYPKRPFIGAIDSLMLGLTETNLEESVGPGQATHRRGTLKEWGINSLHVLVLWILYSLGTLGILPSI